MRKLLTSLLLLCSLHRLMLTRLRPFPIIARAMG
jgi:hypothetical protein